MKQPATFRRLVLLGALVCVPMSCRPKPPAASRPSAPYVANKRSGIVHRADCPHVARMKAANRLGFQKLETAVAEGYRPCKHCLRRAAAASTRRAQE